MLCCASQLVTKCELEGERDIESWIKAEERKKERERSKKKATATTSPITTTVVVVDFSE